MGYRFNAPPNWPAPPSADWLPPEGWRPDASWPAAPEGWNFWVEDPGFAGPSGGVMTTAPPAVTTAPPRENRVRAQLHHALAADLRTGEELRWYGVAYQYKAPALVVGLFSWSILLPIFGPLIALVLRRTWAIGVTSERVMFGLSTFGLKQQTSVAWISVQLRDVTVLRKGHRTGKLIVADPAEGLPAKLTLIRGTSVDELEAILGT